jgi:hypothetical protein
MSRFPGQTIPILIVCARGSTTCVELIKYSLYRRLGTREQGNTLNEQHVVVAV